MPSLQAMLLGSSLLLVLVITGQLAHYRQFLVRLREQHDPVWRELGRPGLTWNLTRGWSSGAVAARFIESRAYADLQDGLLTRHGNRLRWLRWTRSVVFPVFLVLWLAFVVGIRT